MGDLLFGYAFGKLQLSLHIGVSTLIKYENMKNKTFFLRFILISYTLQKKKKKCARFIRSNTTAADFLTWTQELLEGFLGPPFGNH